MKNFALALSVAGLVALGFAITLPTRATAADDPLGSSFTMTTDAGITCRQLRAKVNYVIRCDQDSYMHVATVADGGDNASSVDLIAAQNKAFDFATTWDRTGVCVLPVSALGTCYLYQHRERNE